MSDVEIRFEREGLEGIVPVGTYLSDAAARMGVRFDDNCGNDQDTHCCVVTVTEGEELLSGATAAENEYFAAADGKKGERLACQAKIVSPGELVIMTKEKKKAAEGADAEMNDTNEEYKKQFAEMPLEKKIASLVQLEAIALGETFSFIMNSPYMIFDKAMDVMAEFGLKKEEAARRAGRPEEHVGEEKKAGADNGAGASDKEDAADGGKEA